MLTNIATLELIRPEIKIISQEQRIKCSRKPKQTKWKLRVNHLTPIKTTNHPFVRK